ncbi:MAG: phosphatase PAP2 family protein [Solobacterium sp.]|nr:phosphatase PAP2 family protein [Solobacterium sp.]
MDISILLWFQTIRQALGPVFETIVSILSDTLAYSVAVVPFICYWCTDKQAGKRIIYSLSISMYLNQLLKVAFCIYRPWIRDSRIQPAQAALSSATGYSFPSGHTMTAASVYGSMALLFKDRYRKLSWLCLVLLLLTALSRVVLGVHTPQDVLVGIIASFFSIRIGFFLADGPKSDSRRTLYMIAAGVILSAFGIWFALTRNYPTAIVDGEPLVDPTAMIRDAMMHIGVFAGTFAGGLLEEHTLRFSTEGTRKEKILRLLGGAVGIAFFALFNHILPVGGLPYALVAFARGALAALFAIYLYPLLFTFYRKKKTGQSNV